MCEEIPGDSAFPSCVRVPHAYQGEIVQGAKERSAVLVFGKVIGGRFIRVVSPRVFTLGQLVGVARQNPEDVPREELKLALLRLMVLVGLQGFLYQLVEGPGRLGDCGVHVVRADRKVIFFGVVVGHTDKLLMTPVR